MSVYTPSATNAQQRSTTTIPTTISAFIDSRYAGQQGWACIGWIDGDPRYEKMHEEFYQWPAQRPKLLQSLACLASHVGNIYSAPCLFSERRRHRSTALPSNWLWMDDAPDSVDASEIVQTSATSRQAWQLLDQATSAEERGQLQRAWRNQHPGADTCSADAVHMARVPGGYNTKGHRHQLVTTSGLCDQAISLETLRTQLITHHPSPTTHSSSALDWQAVDHWLGNIGTLLNANGLPRRLKNVNGQTRQILASGPLADTSATRYIVAKGLALHGYQRPVIAALLLHFCDYDKSSIKGSAWLEEDIERTISKVIGELGSEYHPSPERAQGNSPAATRLVIERKHKGRPHAQHLDASSYLRWLQHNATSDHKVLGTRTQNSEQLGVSVATLDRWERTLREAGVITRHTTKSRKDSWIEIDQQAADAFLGTIKNDQAAPDQPQNEVLSHDSISPVVTPSTDTEDNGRNTPPLDSPAMPAAVAPVAPEGASPQGVCSSPSTALVLLLTLLRTAIHRSFDRWQATEKLDLATGELKRCNVTTRRVVADLFSAGLGLAAPELVEQLIVEERHRREALALKLISLNGLRAELRKAESQLAKAERCEQPTAWLRVRIDLLKAEIRTRPPEPEPVRKQRRKGGPAKPDQRAAAKQYELELLDQVDAVLGRGRLRR